MLESKGIATGGGWREVSVHDAAASLAEVRVIDVREPHEYSGPLGHIDGSELFPLGTIAGVAAGWDRGPAVLVVCRSGGRSAQAARALAQLGFKTVYNLTGGMMAWSDAGLPVAR